MMNQLVTHHPINTACMTLDVARSSYQHYLNRGVSHLVCKESWKTISFEMSLKNWSTKELVVNMVTG